MDVRFFFNVGGKSEKGFSAGKVFHQFVQLSEEKCFDEEKKRNESNIGVKEKKKKSFIDASAFSSLI